MYIVQWCSTTTTTTTTAWEKHMRTENKEASHNDTSFIQQLNHHMPTWYVKFWKTNSSCWHQDRRKIVSYETKNRMKQHKQQTTRRKWNSRITQQCQIYDIKRKLACTSVCPKNSSQTVKGSDLKFSHVILYHSWVNCAIFNFQLSSFPTFTFS